MSVFFIQLTVVLVDVCQEVERDAPTVWLACFITIQHSCHWNICKHVSKQGVAIHHVPSNSEEECSGTFAAAARSRGQWDNESSGYEQWDNEVMKTCLKISPIKLKFIKFNQRFILQVISLGYRKSFVVLLARTKWLGLNRWGYEFTDIKWQTAGQSRRFPMMARRACPSFPEIIRGFL